MAAPVLSFVRIKLWITHNHLFFRNRAFFNGFCSSVLCGRGSSSSTSSSPFLLQPFTASAKRNYRSSCWRNLSSRFFSHVGLTNDDDSYYIRWTTSSSAPKRKGDDDEREVERPRSDRDDRGRKGRKDDDLALMQFGQILWPSFFKSFKNLLLTRLVIQLHFDPEFTLEDFMMGTRYAIVKVSKILAEGNLDKLKGLVTDEAIEEIRPNLARMNLKQRQDLEIGMDDMYFGFIHVVGIIFDENSTSQRRFVEITCCFHCLRGFAELKLSDPTLGSMYEHRHRITILNYRLIREFTKGVNDQWMINKLNHFRPQNIR